jgi:hypothetical protein
VLHTPTSSDIHPTGLPRTLIETLTLHLGLQRPNRRRNNRKGNAPCAMIPTTWLKTAQSDQPSLRYATGTRLVNAGMAETASASTQKIIQLQTLKLLSSLAPLFLIQPRPTQWTLPTGLSAPARTVSKPTWRTLTGGTPKLTTQESHGAFLLAARNAEPQNALKSHYPPLLLLPSQRRLLLLQNPTRQCHLESRSQLSPLQLQLSQ